MRELVCDGPLMLEDYARETMRAAAYWLTEEGRQAMIWPDSAEDCASRAWSAARQSLILRDALLQHAARPSGDSR